MSKEAVAKTLKAVNAAKQGTITKTRHVYTTCRFRRPKTQKTPKSNPAPLIPVRSKMDDYRIVQMPVNTEAALRKIENNILTFVCDVKANKTQIAAAVARRFNVKVQKVNTLIRPDCKKKAYVKLVEDCDASEVMSKLGLL